MSHGIMKHFIIVARVNDSHEGIDVVSSLSKMEYATVDTVSALSPGMNGVNDLLVKWSLLQYKIVAIVSILLHQISYCTNL